MDCLAIHGAVRVALASLMVLCVSLPAFSEGAGKPAPTCSFEQGEDRTVTRVIDGETLMLDGGNELRLIGALAPRAFDSAGDAVDWPLAEEARLKLEQLISGHDVRIAFAGRRTDRYGRLLAHAFSGVEQNRVWLQGEMLKLGLARAYALDGSAQCLAELIAHEAVAREAALGLWAEAAYAVRSTDETDALLRLAGTFQLVEGKVAGVSELRGATYLNFDEDWRQDFTVVVRSAARRVTQPGTIALSALNGRRVRVRGWIERRGGPMIDVHHLAAIEVLAVEAESDAAPPAEPRRRSRRR